MIIWIASYPKSGNTWIRGFVSSLVYSKDGNLNMADLEKIKQYPIFPQFNNLIKNKEDLKLNTEEDINLIFKNFIPSQEIINFNDEMIFLKTHFMNCKIGDYNFTNNENTFGTIHVVRDPRNVITSIMNHFHKKTIEEAYKFITNDNNWLYSKQYDHSFPTLISSWKTHYNYWKKSKKNYLLLKYEELVTNPDKEFGKVHNYLNDLKLINKDDVKFKNAISSTKFENFKKFETSGEFSENVFEKTGEKTPFFNLGMKNDYKELLSVEIRKKIEDEFKAEMIELSYL